MKVYHLDVIKSISRFSESIFLPSLCNQTWILFDDTGPRKKYTFLIGGCLYITLNGIGVKGTWTWLPESKSLIITDGDEVFLLRLQFVNNTILVFSLDDTDDFVIFVNKYNEESFDPQNIEQINNYVVTKEQLLKEKEKQMLIAANEVAEKKEAEDLKRRMAFIERRAEVSRKRIDKKRKEKEEAEEEQLMRDSRDLQDELEKKSISRTICIIFLMIGSCGIVYFILGIISNFSIEGFIYYGKIALLSILSLLIAYVIDKRFVSPKIKKWKEQHPDDPRNKYLYD